MKILKKTAVVLLTLILSALLFGCENPEAKKIPTVTVNGKEIRISVTKVSELTGAGYQIGYTNGDAFEAYDLSTSELKIDSGRSYENIELARSGAAFAKITVANYTSKNVELEDGAIYEFSADVNGSFQTLNIKIDGRDIYGKSLTELQAMFDSSTLSDNEKTLTYKTTIDEKYNYTITFTAQNGSVEHVQVKRDI